MDIVKRIHLHWPDMTFELAEEAADEIERLREALQHCVNALAEYEKELDPPPRRKQPADLKPFLLGALDNARSALQQKDAE